MSTSSVVGVIPARYGSTRFPGKPLAEIRGRPMIHWVVDAAREAREIDRVVVATDDERIMEEVESTPAEGWMTPEDCASGSDRVAIVAEAVDCEYVVNIQGDEPLIRGDQLDLGIRAVREDDQAPVGSFMAPVDRANRDDPDVVKVVTDRNRRALYFSRSCVPFPRNETTTIQQHIGIYIYRRDYLLDYNQREPTPLERAESLEQLRILENGDTIRMTELEEATVGVDRPEDIEAVEAELERRD